MYILFILGALSGVGIAVLIAIEIATQKEERRHVACMRRKRCGE
jgi:hypothetical protein